MKIKFNIKINISGIQPFLRIKKNSNKFYRKNKSNINLCREFWIEYAINADNANHLLLLSKKYWESPLLILFGSIQTTKYW